MNAYTVYFQNDEKSVITEVRADDVRQALKKIENFLGYDRYNIQAYEADKLVGEIYCSKMNRRFG